MLSFLGLGRSKSDKSDSAEGPDTVPQIGQLSGTQREMVRFALHNVFKRHGIPADWIAGEIVPVHIPGHGEALLLQLEIMKWNDALMLYAPAIQQELFDELRRFDPDASRARYLFSWKFSPNCQCPHTRMPEPGFWSALKPTAASARSPQGLVSHALPSSGVPAATQAADDADDDHGFPATQFHDAR